MIQDKPEHTLSFYLVKDMSEEENDNLEVVEETSDTCGEDIDSCECDDKESDTITDEDIGQ